MGNEHNLIPFSAMSPEERREIARLGGIASGEARRRRKRLREELEALLADPETQKAVCEGLIAAACAGSASAFSVLRDTIGEKPSDLLRIEATRRITAEEALADIETSTALIFNADPEIKAAASDAYSLEAKEAIARHLMEKSFEALDLEKEDDNG